MEIKSLHRLLGLSLLLFVITHFGNHVALFWGAEQHLAVQEVLRKVYRHPFIEPIIIAAFGAQLFLGARLLLRRGLPRGFWSRLQWLSGLTLMLFLVQHLGAVLYTRAIWPNIDTNVYWAASVVSETYLALYFVPYYSIGVAALFVHMAAILARKQRRPRVAGFICIFGMVFAVGLVVTLAGVFFEIGLPAPYISYLTGARP